MNIRVASVEILDVLVDDSSGQGVRCKISLSCKDGSRKVLDGQGEDCERAVADAISELCVRPISICWVRREQEGGQVRIVLAVQDNRTENARIGVGRNLADRFEDGLVVATLRAASHAALLKSPYRANNQKALRVWSRDLIEEVGEVLGLGEVVSERRLEAEGIVLEHLNRVASAAVITASNYPRPDSILSLFDTSAWLFDAQGRRRDAYTDTDLWLAWYPGTRNDEQTVEEVIQSMPASPPSKIPWIVKAFENPESWLRFRGAVDLEDHDVLHVLLGRGLQDQDEAFVIGFAMGTAKRISPIQYWIFKLVLARLYPEPYRIPKFLQPAFDLGVQCGKETGVKDLYKRQLKELRMLKLGEARRQAGIDMRLVHKYYQLEQQKIPFTIASLRLP